ncbi:41784_t:CDS:2, partial [Gigaspora margarita]
MSEYKENFTTYICMRQIDPRYQTATPNNLAFRLVFSRLQTDKRLREGIYFKTRNGLTELGKVLKKEIQNRQSCIGHYSKHAIIGAIPFSEKLKEINQLLVPLSMFKNTYRDNEYVGNSELNKFQKIKDRGVKNLVFYTDSLLKVEE